MKAVGQSGVLISNGEIITFLYGSYKVDNNVKIGVINRMDFFKNNKGDFDVYSSKIEAS